MFLYVYYALNVNPEDTICRTIFPSIEVNLGANSPNYSYPLLLIFGIEVLASALLMTVNLVVVYTKELNGFGKIVIGGIVGQIFF